jgi:hypothetical protein
MTMNQALLEAHRNNLNRYCRLLASELTPLERDYLHRRIAETRAAIDDLEESPAPQVSMPGAMAQNPEMAQAL